MGRQAGPIRVVRVIARMNVGGPALHVMVLHEGLARRGFEPFLIVGTENPGEGSLMGEALARGIEPLRVPEMVAEGSFKARDLVALVRLYRLIRRIRPHVVHTHTAKAGALGRLAAWAGRAPVIVHTYHGHVLQGYFHPVRTWVLRRMERGLALITDGIVTVSEETRKELAAFGVAPRHRMTVIPLGLELEPFLRADALRGQVRAELGISQGVPLVGIVGRIFPIKNHRLFLDAAALVARQDSRARFLVVGDGVLRSEMEAHAATLGLAERVVFLGWRRDLPRIYADMDVLVISSDNEGTPVSGIEAMAAARPVVATRVGGLVDLVVDGVTGRLVPPRDPPALAAAILSVLRDPAAATMGAAGREVAESRFGASRLVADIEQFYLWLLAGKGIVPAGAPSMLP